jgi:hypothetical protein
VNRSLQKYPWASLRVGQKRLYRARGKRKKELLRCCLLRSAAWYRESKDQTFVITTTEVGGGVTVRRVS